MLKKLARSPNMIKRPKYFLKNLFPQNSPMDKQKAVFTALSSFFGEKPKIPWFSETDKKTPYFLRESTFLRNVSVKHGKQFWQTRRKFSDIKPKTSCSTSNRDMKNTSFSKSKKIFPCTPRMQFWQHHQKSFKIWSKIFNSKSWNDKRFYVSQNN